MHVMWWYEFTVCAMSWNLDGPPSVESTANSIGCKSSMLSTCDCSYQSNPTHNKVNTTFLGKLILYSSYEHAMATLSWPPCPSMISDWSIQSLWRVLTEQKNPIERHYQTLWKAYDRQRSYWARIKFSSARPYCSVRPWPGESDYYWEHQNIEQLPSLRKHAS